jgi:hypothetical protein
MVKERAGAMQLAELITDKIGATGLEIVVRKDHAYGRSSHTVDPAQIELSITMKRQMRSSRINPQCEHLA